MKVSDYIINFLIEKKIEHVFGYPGGMVTDIMNSLEEQKEHIKAHISYHEQASAFAACGLAQITHKPGVCYATSGPGATNLITGIANAYFDSIPCIFLTGQVNSNDSKKNLLCRQKGFQETDIVSIVSPVTKYAQKITNETEIQYELEKAYYICMDGRPGPVLLDIPINVQKQEINVAQQKFFSKKETNELQQEIINEIQNQIENSKRPVIIAGNGINIANVKEDFKKLVNKWKIPVVTSMIAIDCIETKSPYCFGFIGAYGKRYANIIVEKSDLIISIGSRLDLRQTGPVNKFALHSKLIRIDVDKNELTNKIKENEIQINTDLKNILPKLEQVEIKPKELWLKNCGEIKNQLKDIDKKDYHQFICKLCNYISPKSIITTDVGQNQVWVAQYCDVKQNQRILFSGGHGSMGYSLPAAIGASFADKNKIVISINGDGGFQMNIQELQFIARENLPIKIIILNNHSLGMIRHFQEMYFASHYVQTVENNGYKIPDFCKIANAYGIKSYKISKKDELETIKTEFLSKKPVLINIEFPKKTHVYPKLAMGEPVYNQDPLLDQNLLQKLLKENME